MTGIGRTKIKPFGRLKGALEDAEAKIQEDNGQNLNGLCEILNDYLRRGDEPERRQLLREYERGGQLTGEHGIRRSSARLTWSFLAAHILAITFLGPRRIFTAI